MSITSPIKEILQFVAAFGAVMFLGENFTVPIGIATVLTVAGVILLSSTSDATRTSSQLKWKRRDLIFPFSAAVLYGMARILRKLGMVTLSSPWGAGTIMATVSVLFLWFFLMVMKNNQKQRVVFNKNSAAFFTLGGILGGLGQVCMLTALKVGDVVIVGPITATAPLFAISLTYIFFRKYEKINLDVILGALIIMSGVVILTLASS